MVSAAAITQGGLGQLDGHWMDVDPDYVLLQLLQGCGPRQTRLSGSGFAQRPFR